MNRPPITAIVIFRNERHLLERCFESLRWCDELIAIDMASSDGSAEVAQRYADRLFSVPAYPIAEPTRVAAVRLARHDWVLLVDPDEVIPPTLAARLQEAIATQPTLGAVRLPWRFYFKGQLLTGTVWGTRTFKRMLIHRQRCRLLPHCNRITELMSGYEEATLPHEGNDPVRHYWSNSYRNLLHKHFRRYAHLEAKAKVANGERFSLRMGLIYPFQELRRCLKDFDGWRMGVRGFLLSGIYFGYVLASCWLMLWYQRRSAAQGEHPTAAELPTLIEQAKGESHQATPSHQRGAEAQAGPGCSALDGSVARGSMAFPPRSQCPSPETDDMNPLPRITIVTPSYNQAAFLETTLRSVLDQGYPNLQYGVVDGASTDGSDKIIARYRNQLDFAIIEPDRGQVDALNKGLSRADGEIVGFINSDDTLLPGCLETVGRFFAEHPEADWVVGDCVQIDAEGNRLRVLKTTGLDSLAHLLVRDKPVQIPQPSMFWRRRLLDQHGMFDEAFEYKFDFDMWCRFIAAGVQLHRIEGELGTYRLHEHSKTCALSHLQLADHLVIERAYAHRLPWRDRLRLERRLGYRTRQLALWEKGTQAPRPWKEVARRPWWLLSQQVRAALWSRAA